MKYKQSHETEVLSGSVVSDHTPDCRTSICRANSGELLNEAVVAAKIQIFTCQK